MLAHWHSICSGPESVRLCVCLSVRSRCSIKMAKHIGSHKQPLFSATKEFDEIRLHEVTPVPSGGATHTWIRLKPAI